MPGPYQIIAGSTLADLDALKRETLATGDAGTLTAIGLAARASAAANSGEIETAGPLLHEALAAAGERADHRLLFLAFQFFFRTGDLDEAERLARRRIERTGAESAHAARAWCNLGLVQHTRGDFDAAEASMQRAIAIDRAIGDERGLARDLGNLALVPESRGDLDRAESLYLESLAIAERLGDEDIMYTKLANLGDVALLRGDRARARDHWNRAVALFEKLGNAKAMDMYAPRLSGLDGGG